MTLEDAVKKSEDGVKMIKTGEKIENLLWKIFTAGVIIAFLLSFFVHPVFATGISMAPTIKDGTILICNRTVNEYHADDIVFIKIDNGTIFPLRIIKRVVGVPGDTIDIRNGILYVNNIAENRGFETMESAGSLSYPLVLGEEEYFVLGDNRNHSSDSREYGVFNRSQLTGRLSITGLQTGLHLFQ